MIPTFCLSLSRPLPRRTAGRLLIALLATAPALLGCAPARQAGDALDAGVGSGVVAFTNVNVVPMDRERVLERQTVLVRDGRIEQVGPAASVRVPAGATRVDGEGKYLMPGLAEMHAHIPGPQTAPELIENILFLYIANGVTTIRGMLGAPNQLELRERTARGELLGPTIIVGAPSLNQNSAPDPETAARLVREHQAAGYDFLKIHGGFGRPVYDAIVRTAREVGITWAGHIDHATGLEHKLATRQSTIDHLDGYLQAALPEALRARVLAGEATLGEAVRNVDPARVRALAEATREAGVWNVPTMYLWESFASPQPAEAFLQLPEMRYAPPQLRNSWVQQKQNIARNQQAAGQTEEDLRLSLQRRREILKALGDAGAPLLLGTDSPQMFNVPGFSLHHELRVMAESGLTPYQILESGTRNVALYAEQDLGLDGRFGTVAPGQRADLILLTANPLQDVGNVARREGVMVRGTWVPESEIQRRLAELAREYAG
jgi:imidazolonepropionase-like amidohydrolase